MSSESSNTSLRHFLTGMRGNIQSWVYPGLIILATIKIITGISCLALILTPICRGRLSRQKHLWLVRKRYLHSDSKTPYFVPNSSLVVVMCELLSSALYVMLACVNYSNFKDGFVSSRRAHHMTSTLGYGISFLPTFISVWLTGWGLLYSCHCPNSNVNKQVINFFGPRMYNSCWIIGCLLVVVIMAHWAIALGRVYAELWNHRVELLGILAKIGPHLIDSPAQINQGLLLLLQNSRVAFMDSGSKLVKHMRVLAGFWLACEFLLVALYVFILQRLVKLIRRLLRFCEAEQFEILNRPGSANNPIPVSKRGVHKSVVALSAFRQQLRFLAVYNFSITLVLLGEVTSACLHFYACGRPWDAVLMGVLSVVVMVPSIFLSPVLLYQSWRIITERSVSQTEESQLVEVPIASESIKPEHRLFHERLWKWYNGRRLDENECLQLDGHSLTKIQSRRSCSSSFGAGQDEFIYMNSFTKGSPLHDNL
ncbi:hypothetical protein O181_023914 [Austropuccinia psidii MF-1]|uniref:Uncharacterized protein n=1 Tax=Austropuccinia psidii MF-1 TaxID=1389203 RepID=A0A9Q3CFA9_9BASI|nr:hypothetical protein [Austropuccinia psidii MF-1]